MRRWRWKILAQRGDEFGMRERFRSRELEVQVQEEARGGLTVVSDRSKDLLLRIVAALRLCFRSAEASLSFESTLQDRVPETVSIITRCKMRGCRLAGTYCLQRGSLLLSFEVLR